MPSLASAPELQKNTLSAKRVLDQPRGQTFGLRDAIQVGDVHHLGRLLGDRLGQMRMAVAERGGGDAGAEIEESSPVHRPQPGALAPLESEVGTGVVRHQGGDHGVITLGRCIPNGSPVRDHSRAGPGKPGRLARVPGRVKRRARRSKAGASPQTPPRGAAPWNPAKGGALGTPDREWVMGRGRMGRASVPPLARAIMRHLTTGRLRSTVFSYQQLGGFNRGERASRQKGAGEATPTPRG